MNTGTKKMKPQKLLLSESTDMLVNNEQTRLKLELKTMIEHKRNSNCDMQHKN